MSDSISLAVIGCGAIAESFYLPVLAADAALRGNVWLVDPSVDRATALAGMFGFDPKKVAASVADLPDDVRAAVNATPSHLHVATTLPLIERGVAVLVEKPFAEYADDARALLAAAAQRGSLLSVNQFRRLGPSYELAREWIRSGRIGTVRSVKWAEGHKFEWPTQSGFNFRRPWPKGRPRGCLLDVGIHVLDIIHWWLDEELKVERAYLDGYGGPEAFVNASLRSSTAAITFSVSFLEKLENRYVVEGDKGSIRGFTGDFDALEYKPAGGRWSRVTAPGDAAYLTIAKRMVDNLVGMANGTAQPLVSAESTLRVIAAVDSIYEVAQSDLPAYYREWVA